ncbi:MAG: ABC transporter permease [Terriglobales bacterium]
MRNLLLVTRREYLGRVRTRSFIISTIALPVLLAAAMLLPQKFATMKSQRPRHIVVVAATAELGEAVKRHLLSDPGRMGVTYTVDVATETSDAQRKRLTEQVAASEIDGYLWMPAEAIAQRKITYSGREVSDFMDVGAIKMAVTYAWMEQQMVARGIDPEATKDLLRDVKVETLRVQRGKETRTSTAAGFLTSFIMVMLLYTTLLLYGMAVMRAVIEEKTSRVMEVLLSSATARDLMTGKILGVGAAGLTQVLIWIIVAGLFVLPAAASGAMQDLSISPLAIGSFAVFFLLGYLLYSAIYAAIGAMVNSEQEGQQLAVAGMFPLIIAISLMMLVLRQPNAPASVWLSMVPFFTPILMHLRIAVYPPPLWQIALSIVLLALTVWGMTALCGRIYRVGILMYGKRPTLPEVMKWLKYAKV